MPVTTTTTLPDADQPVLGNGVEDEISVDRETQPTNYGDVRWQVRETGESSWSGSATGFDESTVAFDTITFAILNREDGEEYEVRLRTETEHRTGSWTSPVSIITKFPGATNLSASDVAQTTLDLSWSDNSDNEDGFDVQRRKDYASGFGPWRTIATLTPNTTAYTDSTVQPNRTYEHRIRAFTDDTDATSSSIQTTTTDAGVRQRDVPARGWYVEVDHPDRDQPRTLQPGEAAQAQPTLNDLPEVTIPVRKADHWIDSETWGRQPMRVWRDGERLPITQLAEIRETAGGIELVGRGGIRKGSASDDIRQVVAREYASEGAHTVIEEVLDEVGIANTVDDPPDATNQLIATLDTTPEFATYLTATTPDAPILTAGDQVAPAQTCYLTAPQDISSSKLEGDTRTNWTATEAVAISVTDEPNVAKVSWTIDLDYAIPGEDVEIYVRGGDDFVGRIRLEDGDGNPLGEEFRSSQQGRSGDKDVSWLQFAPFEDRPTVGGQVTINLYTDDGGDSADGTFYLDCAAVYDATYWDGSDFVNTLDGEKLDGGPPGLYAPVDADYAVTPILRTEGARLEATLSSTANGQALGVSPGGANSFTTAANADTLETDFTDSYGSFVARTTLGGVNATTTDTNVESSVTTYRTEPQILQDLTLKYDSLNTPTVARPVEDRAIDIVNELADRADLLWELQWDPSIDDVRVVAALPGQRTSDSDPDLADYRVEKNVEAEIHQALVRGRTEQVTAEEFVSDKSGTALANDRVQKDSERVYDPDTGTEFVRGPNEDYEMEYLLGNIVQTAGSNMTEGETYEISYREKTRGEAFQPNSDFQNPAVTEITALTTDPECEEAAAFILQQNDEPLWTAEVTIPRREAGFDLIDEIDPSRLPSPPNGGYRLTAIDESPRQLTLTLGSRPTLSETIQRIRTFAQQTARDV